MFGLLPYAPTSAIVEPGVAPVIPIAGLLLITLAATDDKKLKHLPFVP